MDQLYKYCYHCSRKHTDDYCPIDSTGIYTAIPTSQPSRICHICMNRHGCDRRNNTQTECRNYR